MKVHCADCGCNTVYKYSKPMPKRQKAPNPDCECTCHAAYWLMHGDSLRTKLRGKAA